jgi:hypothetical protein
MNETKPKKMVSRNVVVALGIICIIILASLGGILIVLYDANQQNTNLQSELTDTVNLTKSRVYYNNLNLTTANNTVGDLQDKYGNTAVASFQIWVNCSGFLVVTIRPTNLNLKVDVSWAMLVPSSILAYEQEYNAGYLYYLPPDTNYFPVLSGSQGNIVTIIIFSNSTALPNSSMTVTYYY